MQPPIAGGVALITGASSGIGAAFARELAPRARTLILVARRAERLSSLAKELAAYRDLRVDVRACDLTDRKALDELITAVEREHGGVDVLVNNAGRGAYGVFDLSHWDASEQLIELNVRAPLYLIRRLAPGMISRGRGGILNISSGIAFMPLFPSMATYTASKHFLNAASESLRAELAPAGVVVTTVCPGPVESEFLEASGAGEGDRPPAFLMLSAEACARASLRAFERNQALVMPGFMNWLSGWMVRVTPRFVLQLAFGALGKSLRKKQLLQAGAPAE